MPQTLAMDVQVPSFDVGGVLSRVGQIKSQDIANQRNQNQLQDESDQSSALRNYRTRAGQGDPNALDALKGYPELQSQIHTALDQMTPTQRTAAGDKINAWHDSALAVLSAPPGSPARTQAWNDQIDSLEKQGHLTKDQAAFARKTGPTDLMIHEVLGVKGALDSYKAPVTMTAAELNSLWKNSLDAAGLSAGGATASGVDATERTKRLQNAEDIYNRAKGLITSGGYTSDQAIGAAKAGKGDLGAPAGAKGQDRVAQSNGDGGVVGNVAGFVNDRLGDAHDLVFGKPSGGPPGGSAVAAPGKPGPSARPGAPDAAVIRGSGTQIDPVVFADLDEAAVRAAAQALPSRTWFVNPATGQPLQKR